MSYRSSGVEDDEGDFHPMTRALNDDAASRDAAADANGGAAAPRAAVGAAPPSPPAEERHVCPFCGSLNVSAIGPCPRCTMENTPATRKATKARIGPWYVLQQRNPAAPGMRFETLLTFIRKGRVKPRSVVRGPSTHQLWRYAMQVRGVSREFGLCYSYGGMIDRDAMVCPRCSRSQEPPTNPDALLENGEAAATMPAAVTAVLHKDLSASAASVPVTAADIVVPTLGNSAPVVERPVADADKGAAAVGTSGPAPEDLPPRASVSDAASPPVTQTTKPSRTASPAGGEPPAAWHVNDLAAAFGMSEPAPMSPPMQVGGGGRTSLPGGGGGSRRDGGGGGDGGGGEFSFRPYGEGGRAPDVPAVLVNDLPPFYPRQRSWRRPVLTLVLVGMLGVVIWLCFDDIARRQTGEWFQEAYHALRRTGGDNTVVRQRNDSNPSRDARASGGKGVRPKTQQTQTTATKTTTTNPLLPPPPPDLNPAPETSPDPSTRRVAAAPVAPTTAPLPGSDIVAANPVQQAGQQEFPYTAPDNETVPPNVSKTASAPAPAPAPPSLEVQAQEAKALFNKAIDAQAARDFPEVVRLLEQIKSTYPKEAWPGGLEIRLQLAKGQIK